MTDKDKTVGGQTRPWWEALFEKWLPGLQSLHDLLDEAFEGHSRGLRDGLERAAPYMSHRADCLFWNKSPTRAYQEPKTSAYLLSDRCSCGLADLFRAEASKLDGRG
jgi:hypothetical protein